MRVIVLRHSAVYLRSRVWELKAAPEIFCSIIADFCGLFYMVGKVAICHTIAKSGMNRKSLIFAVHNGTPSLITLTSRLLPTEKRYLFMTRRMKKKET